MKTKRKKMQRVKPIKAWALADESGYLHQSQIWGDDVHAVWADADDAKGWCAPKWRVVKVEIREVPKKRKRSKP